MPMRVSKPVRRSLLWEDAYELLTQAIICGDLAPGEQVHDSAIAQRMGLSRTPVREALNRLIDVGLVESKVGSYTRVASLSRRDAETSLAVLKALDELAVREGLPRIGNAGLRQMREANRGFASAVRLGSAGEALAADDRFHGVLIDSAQNPLLSRLIGQVHPQIHRILYRKFSSKVGSTETTEHHDHMIELCEAGDVDRAALVSAEHWEHLGGLIGEFFDEDETAGAADPRAGASARSDDPGGR